MTKKKHNIQFIDKNPKFWCRCVDCDKLLGVVMDSNIQEGWILCIPCMNMRIKKGDIEDDAP